jgi:hypothetical protein
MIKYLAVIDVQISLGCSYYFLDASVAAITVYEFLNGRGYEIGLGTIVLPRIIFL